MKYKGNLLMIIAVIAKMMPLMVTMKIVIIIII